MIVSIKVQRNQQKHVVMLLFFKEETPKLHFFPRRAKTSAKNKSSPNNFSTPILRSVSNIRLWGLQKSCSHPKSVPIMRLWRMHKQSSNFEECFKHALVKNCTSIFLSEVGFRRYLWSTRDDELESLTSQPAKDLCIGNTRLATKILASLINQPAQGLCIASEAHGEIQNLGTIKSVRTISCTTVGGADYELTAKNLATSKAMTLAVHNTRPVLSSCAVFGRNVANLQSSILNASFVPLSWATVLSRTIDRGAMLPAQGQIQTLGAFWKSFERKWRTCPQVAKSVGEARPLGWPCAAPRQNPNSRSLLVELGLHGPEHRARPAQSHNRR